MTVSDIFAAAATAAVPDGSLDQPVEGRTYARARARGYRSLSVWGKVTGFAAVVWADLRSAWWTPTSLPTVARAWSERIPDRTRVPGDSRLLYGFWLASNHTVGLLVPVVVTGLVGLLTPLVWASRHPARYLLAAAIAVVVGLVVGA